MWCYSNLRTFKKVCNDLRTFRKNDLEKNWEDLIQLKKIQWDSKCLTQQTQFESYLVDPSFLKSLVISYIRSALWSRPFLWYWACCLGRQLAMVRNRNQVLWIIRCFVWHLQLTHCNTMVFMSVKCPPSLVTQTWGDRGLGVNVRVSDPYHSTDGCRKPQWFMNATVCVSLLETDGFCDNVCDSHLQSVRATESGHCSEWAAMASSAGTHRAHSTPTGYSLTSSLKNVSGTLLTKAREVWKTKGFGNYPSEKLCVWMCTSDSRIWPKVMTYDSVSESLRVHSLIGSLCWFSFTVFFILFRDSCAWVN